MKVYIKSKVLENKEISTGIFEMKLLCKDIAINSIPGQFLNIHLPNGELILPRPISICEIDKNEGSIRVLYKIMGKGTEVLSKIEPSCEININGPLGNGFTIENCKNVAILGGGIGIPPLFELSKRLKDENKDINIKAFLGARDKDNIVLENDFKNINIDTYCATDDGAYGFKGNTLDCFIESKFNPDIIYGCGPKVMLKYIAKYANEKTIKSQLSFEERMACGIGSCVCCVVKIKNDSKEGFEYKKVCKDGPVFLGTEVLWDE